MREPRRIQLRRAKGWRIADVSNSYKIVDRRSDFGNPWTIHGPSYGKWAVQRADRHWPIVGSFDTKNEAAAFAVDQYKRWLTDDEFAAQFPKLASQRNWVVSHLHLLRGKDLACWCTAGAPCHVDVLLPLAAQTGSTC